MPPKFDANDPTVVKLTSLFQSVGLSAAKALDAARSPKQAVALQDLIERNGLETRALDEKQGNLISSLSVQAAKLGLAERTLVVEAIVACKLKSTEQVAGVASLANHRLARIDVSAVAAVRYLETHPVPVNDAEFEAECGIGYSITSEELYSSVHAYVVTAGVTGWASLSSVVGGLKSDALRWASPLEVKNMVDRVFSETFGEKEAKPAGGKDSKPAAKAVKLGDGTARPSAPSTTALAPAAKSVFEEGFLGSLHKPGGNPQSEPHLREAHLAATGGMVVTRFPPEPNGFLHIGHSKAIFVNFGYAAHHGGKCYLRYDDTNPEAEEAQYFESILEIVRWLGFEPCRITYSSDYFQQLYDLGLELIRRDKGYCCSCTGDDMHRDRGGDNHGPRSPCSHRGRPIGESLKIFVDMKNGKYKPGEMTMRMKQDLMDGNPQMWDLVAYRVLNAVHHRTGSEWCIYPTYDFTHCLVDSFENISHSLCTVEFILSRVSYEWLCDAVSVYKPRQSEYGRLNIEGTIMSKRKLLRLVNDGHVQGWDDPRMYTLVALRRRGIPPGAIISFVSTLGVSTAPSNIQVSRFDQVVRQYLESSAPRLLMVLRPLKVTIENLPGDYVQMITKPLHPKVDLGTSSIPFTRTIYIDAEDFRVQDSKDYFRLAPGKTVGLFQAPHIITCTSFKSDPATGTVTELICRVEEGQAPKPKAFIQWVAEHPPSGSPVRVDETRIFNRLFKSDNPAAAKPDFIADINSDSLEVVNGAMVEIGFYSLAKAAYNAAKKEAATRTECAQTKASKDESATVLPTGHNAQPSATSEQLVGNECVRFQGLRIAYFALDKDARLGCLNCDDATLPGYCTGDSIILNRIVSLKEDAGKAS